MNQDLLQDISRALEGAFYRERDAALLEYLRAQADEDAMRTQLSSVSQIDDAAVLDSLVQIGMTAESFAAFSLFPLVRVAWADGIISQREREAVLRAATDEGIAADSTSYQLLEGWLDERPKTVLSDAWQNYARALAQELNSTQIATIRDRTLNRARRVAAAAGGILGLGNPISKSEELALLDLSHALDKPAELQ